jgi:hypothetical protein
MMAGMVTATLNEKPWRKNYDYNNNLEKVF